VPLPCAGAPARRSRQRPHRRRSIRICRTQARTHAPTDLMVHTSQCMLCGARRRWHFACGRLYAPARLYPRTHLVCGRPDVRYTSVQRAQYNTEGPSGIESAETAYRLLDCCASE
jgi:hypothetical protein